MDCRLGLRHSRTRMKTIIRALLRAHLPNFSASRPPFELQMRRSFAQIGPRSCTLPATVQRVDLLTQALCVQQGSRGDLHVCSWARMPRELSPLFCPSRTVALPIGWMTNDWSASVAMVNLRMFRYFSNTASYRLRSTAMVPPVMSPLIATYQLGSILTWYFRGLHLTLHQFCTRSSRLDLTGTLFHWLQKKRSSTASKPSMGRKRRAQASICHR